MRACYLAAFMLLLMWRVLAGAADAPAALTPDDVSVDYRDGTYFASFILRAAVAPGVAQEVLTDFEHMADFVPNLTSSRVLARTGNRYRIAQQGKANFGPFSFHFESERYIEVFADGRILAQAIAGSSKSMHSEMQIHSEGRGTRLEYHVEMVPEQWIPSSIGVNLLRHELAEQFSAITREMERRQRQRISR